VSDTLFCTEEAAMENLRHERILNTHLVGNVMVDALKYQLSRIVDLPVSETVNRLKDKATKKYAVVTLHRPSNVDDKKTLERLLLALEAVSMMGTVILPAHPRLHQKMDEFGLRVSEDVILTEPLRYVDFLRLWKNATVVLTDSGGLQDETTALGVPCVTLRNTTERPCTVEVGTSVLAGSDEISIVKYASSAFSGEWKKASVPPLWDGFTARRIVNKL
jgi:UDP-N-acetylglucosamine 2-epimerase (non-hydrolysing)